MTLPARLYYSLWGGKFRSWLYCLLDNVLGIPVRMGGDVLRRTYVVWYCTVRYVL